MELDPVLHTPPDEEDDEAVSIAPPAVAGLDIFLGLSAESFSID